MITTKNVTSNNSNDPFCRSFVIAGMLVNSLLIKLCPSPTSTSTFQGHDKCRIASAYPKQRHKLVNLILAIIQLLFLAGKNTTSINKDLFQGIY